MRTADLHRSVWVIDDSPLDVERARQALALDCEVTTFTDPAVALERLAARSAPDVLVLDWIMPNLSGIEVCQYLRSSGGPLEQLGILLLTGARETDQIVMGLEAGADDYLAKPYADAELRARVGALLRTRELHARSQRAEAKVLGLLESIPDAVIALDERGAVVFANQEAARAFGVPAQALLGRLGAELLPDLVRFWGKAGAPRLLNLPDIALGGRIYAATVKTGAEAEAGFVSVALRDVTETRREETRRMDFYSMVAHDMRSPLTAMIIRNSLIESGKYGPLTPALIGEVRKNDNTMKSLLKLINDFTEFARLEGAGLKLERAVVDMVDLTLRGLDELRPLAEARRQRMEFAPPAVASPVVGDASRLIQVLCNLLSNAIKFTPQGGVIDVSLARREQVVEIRVKDTGPGIPAEARATLFDRFTRVETPGLSIAGTGLGLMIAKQIVEAHGGSIGLESQLGAGSTFWFAVPCASEPV